MAKANQAKGTSSHSHQEDEEKGKQAKRGKGEREEATQQVVRLFVEHCERKMQGVKPSFHSRGKSGKGTDSHAKQSGSKQLREEETPNRERS